MRTGGFARYTVRRIRGDSEREQVEELRYRVYVEEMGKPYAGADHRARRLADALDGDSVILAAFDHEDRVVGTVRCTLGCVPGLLTFYGDVLGLDAWRTLVPAHALAVCSRLVVERKARGGASVSLMSAMYAFGRDAGVIACLCSTIPPLVPFFRRFGFRVSGAPFLDRDSQREQIPLALLLDDIEHLQRVRSPFLAYASGPSDARQARPTSQGWWSPGADTLEPALALPLSRV